MSKPSQSPRLTLLLLFSVYLDAGVDAVVFHIALIHAKDSAILVQIAKTLLVNTNKMQKMSVCKPNKIKLVFYYHINQGLESGQVLSFTFL